MFYYMDRRLYYTLRYPTIRRGLFAMVSEISEISMSYDETAGGVCDSFKNAHHHNGGEQRYQ